MVLKIKGPNVDAYLSKRFLIKLEDIDNICTKEMDYFITSESMDFFKRFEISHEFSEVDPREWPVHESFQKGLNIVKGLKVVNDVAERAVKLVTDYNNLLTKDAAQKQYTVQIVAENRKLCPDASKEKILKVLCT